jgi:hypothetical protein
MSDATNITEVEGHKPKEIEIKIDRQKIKLPKQDLTGQILRTLAEPDIGADRDLYLEGKGHDEDQLIENDESVHLKDGMHFFSAPASIQPGHAA